MSQEDGMSESVDITGVDLVKLVQKAYELSVPIGLGFLHYVAGDKLSEDEASSHIHVDAKGFYDGRIIRLDYVRGRACKLNVYKRNGCGDKLFTDYPWYDHTHMQFIELLRYSHPDFESIRRPGFHNHSASCTCQECKAWLQAGLKENIYGI